jgi:Fe2+ transport system protein B
VNAMPVVTIPRALREKLGDEATESLVELLNKMLQGSKEDVISLSGEKFERRLAEEFAKFDSKLMEEVAKVNKRIDELSARITEEVAKLDAKITEEVTKLDAKITEEITKLEARINQRITEEVSKLRVEMSSYYASIVRWMFIFWVGQIGVIIGILFAFFRR